MPVCNFYGVLLAGQTKKRKCLDWTWCLENGDLCVSRNSGTCFAGPVGNNINSICQSLFDLERVPLHSGVHEWISLLHVVSPICRTVCYQLRPLGVRNIKHKVSETNGKVCSVLFVNWFERNVLSITLLLGEGLLCSVYKMERKDNSIPPFFLLLTLWLAAIVPLRSFLSSGAEVIF